MRGSRVWLVSGLGLLVVAQCWVVSADTVRLPRPHPVPPATDGGPTAAGPVTAQGSIVNSYAIVPASPALPAGAPSAPLRLPVHVAPLIPLRVAQGGETFYTVSFPLDYTGGPVTLAGDAAGTRNSSVDGQMIMKVTHPDGTVSTYQDGELAETFAPMDLSRYFQKGVNAVDVTLRDTCGGVMSCTDLWLTDRKPTAARLPLVLLDGVMPESAWPQALANVTVAGPSRGWKVMLAGDREGRAGTWATGPLTLHVRRADGSTRDASYDYTAPQGPPQLRPPADVTDLFGPGANTVDLAISTNGAVASSPIWLALVRQ